MGLITFFNMGPRYFMLKTEEYYFLKSTTCV